MALIKHDERYGPYMTANSAPAPYAATASQNSWGAFRAFSESLDDDISFTGLAAGTEQWVQIKLDAPIRIWAFRIACRTTVSAKDAGQVPKNFVVQGSADGTVFEDIQAYTDMDWEQFTSWDAAINKYDWADSKKIEINCTKEYQYYRFLFGECQSVSTQKTGSMTPTSSDTVKPTLIDLYQVEGEAGPDVTGIRITHEPDKLRYEVGIDLDSTGLEVTADLSDGSTQIITDYTLSGYDSAATGIKTVTVTYKDFSATFNVTIYELSSIKITTLPDKIKYNIGDTLDLSGMVVTAIYSDGVTETVTDYTVSGFDSSTDAVVVITVTYQGKSDAFTVTVGVVKEVMSITVTTLPDKLTYLINESLNTTGMVVTATYDDGTTGIVTGYTLTGFDSSTSGNKTVTVTYREKTATFSITIVRIVSINVAALPYKTDYGPGEPFITTGLVIEAVFEDGRRSEVTDYTLSGFDSSVYGEKVITVTYKEFTTTFVVRVHGATEGIRISRYPDKVYYKIGDTLDSTGLEVVAITEGGLERPLTDYTLSALDSSTAGNKDIKVTYEVIISADTKAAYFADFTVKVTATGDNPFDGDSVLKSVRVHWPNGEFADLENEHIQSNTFELKESICNDNYFIFGGCICNYVKFTTMHEQFIPEDSYPEGMIEIYIQCRSTEVKVFTGVIDSGKRTSDLLKREIIAYDQLYMYRNTDIARWYKNITTDAMRTYTQKQFRDKLFDYLGIEQVATKLYYDDAHVPDTQKSTEMIVTDIIKDLCLQNSVFGIMNRDGKFEYLKLPENSYLKSMDNAGNLKYDYYASEIYYDNYESLSFNEGRIWFPKNFHTEPEPNFLFTDGPPESAQEAYENNVYYNRNSFFVGDSDWLNAAWQVDEYKMATVDEPIFPICYGITNITDTKHLYRAQQYQMTVPGNPLNTVGQSIEIFARRMAGKQELHWTIHSYIMSRTLKFLGDTCLRDTYEARNAPYNGNNTQLGKATAELSAGLNQTRNELPVISYSETFTDGASLAANAVTMDDFRVMKILSQQEHEALIAAGGIKTNTAYGVYYTK